MSTDLFCRNSPCPCLSYPGCKTAQAQDKAASSRDPYCLCPSCLGTQIKDEECHMTKYNCNCDASAGAPDHARTCPEHRDFGTTALAPAPRQSKMANSPQFDLYAAGAAAIHAGFHIPEDLDASLNIGFDCNLRVTVGQLRALISSNSAGEAELYAAQDQVAGLQELMEDQAKVLSSFVEHHDTHQRSLTLTLDEQVEQDLLWFGAVEKALTMTATGDLRKYASQDIKAVETFSREVELHAALVKAQKVIDMLFPGVSKIFGVDFQELNECCIAVSQALKVKR